jgi:hypothetical protein
VPTSLEQTLLAGGDTERLLSIETPSVIAGGDDGIRVIGLGLAGRRDEARARLEAMRNRQSRIPAFESWIVYLTAWLDNRREGMNARRSQFEGLRIQEDPEAIFQEGWMRCHIGEHEAGLQFLQRAIAKRYYAVPTLSTRPQFDALRSNPVFQSLLSEAEAGRDQGLAAFRAAGGERLLGL